MWNSSRPGKRSWLAEGCWHMLLEAIWDGVWTDGPVSVLFSWRDYTVELEKPIRRGVFKRCDGPNLQLQRFLNSVKNQFFSFCSFFPDNYAFAWILMERICPWLAQVEFYAKLKGLTYDFRYYFWAPFENHFSTDNQFFQTDNNAFQLVKRSDFVNLTGRHWTFCPQWYAYRHSGHNGAYKLSIHSWAVFDFLPVLIRQSIRSQIGVKKKKKKRKKPSISETQRIFQGFSAFHLATKSAQVLGIYSIFDHDEGLGFHVSKAYKENHCQDARNQPRSVDFELRSRRDPKTPF